MLKRHKLWMGAFVILVALVFGYPAVAEWRNTGAWDTITRFLGVAHTWTADQTFDSGMHLVLPQDNDPGTPTLAFGDGDSGLFQDTDGRIGIANNGVFTWSIRSTGISGNSSSGPSIGQSGTSSIVPIYTFAPDTNVGMGRAAADQLSLIAGGVEGVRITEAQRTIETDATVCETDGGDLRVVTTATHALSVDDVTQYVDGTGSLCANITAATNYYVTQVDDANKFNIAASRGGSNIAYSTAGTAFSSFEQEITINFYGPIGSPIKVSGTAPGLSSCGTTPAITGSDVNGKITIGTGATTSCTATFAVAHAAAPACVIAGDNSAITYAATTSTTVLTITSSGDMASDVISYICLGIL